MVRPLSAAAPPAALLRDHTGYLLHRAGFLMISAVEQNLAPLDLTGRKFFAMTALRDLAPLSQRDLSDLFTLDPAVVVAMVNELEEAGLVVRRRSTADKRRYELALTPTGTKLLVRATTIVTTVEESLLSDLGPRQRTTLHRLLEIVLRQDNHA